MYDLIIYHNKDGDLVMDVRTEAGVVIVKAVKIPKRINIVDGDRHRDDGRVAAAFDIDMLRRRGMEDFAHRINSIE